MYKGEGFLGSDNVVMECTLQRGSPGTAIILAARLVNKPTKVANLQNLFYKNYHRAADWQRGWR